MQTNQTTAALMGALTDSLARLESLMEQRPSVWLQAIIVRRRRAAAALRGFLRNTRRRAGSAGRPRSSEESSLLVGELRLLSLYDAALSDGGGPRRGVLLAQRAEAEQAVIELTALLGTDSQGHPPA